MHASSALKNLSPNSLNPGSCFCQPKSSALYAAFEDF